MNSKVNIMIASLYEREDCLIDTLNSLLPQLRKSDTINLYLQNYPDRPKVLDLFDRKINIIYDWEYKDLQSNQIQYAELGIYLFENIKGYVFTCDDDLIYPATYIKDTIKRYNAILEETIGHKAIVSYHGHVIKKLPIANFYQDIYVHRCLQEVDKDYPIDIAGAGVLCYHTDIFNFQKTSNELAKYPIWMRDIHLSLQAKREKISMICLKHDLGYIKYNSKMKNIPTIWDTEYQNPVVQTKLINDFELPFTLWKDYEEDYNPLVDIVIINSRQLTHPQYVAETFNSIRNQSYENIKPYIVSNYNKLMTIGKCWNEAVKQCEGEWVFFLGDDDFITEDYIHSLITEYKNLPSDYKEKVVMVSSFCTIFRDSGEIDRKDIIPTGMWKRDYLLKYPFKEFLTKLVDSSYMDACKERGDIMHVVQHQYGLYYRSHAEQVSGTKAIKGEATGEVDNRIQKQLMKMNLE